MRKIENDAVKYKQLMVRQRQMAKQVDPLKQKPTVIADGNSSITQIKAKAAGGDYKAWRKKAIADALKRGPRIIKYKELPREKRRKKV